MVIIGAYDDLNQKYIVHGLLFIYLFFIRDGLLIKTAKCNRHGFNAILCKKMWWNTAMIFQMEKKLRKREIGVQTLWTAILQWTALRSEIVERY